MKFDRIFLVGFRTTGKTSIGKILAEKIGWNFLDLDFLITQEAGEDAEALTKRGADWEKFRTIENQILKEVSEMKNVVISCGGGVGINDIIDESGKTFGELNKETLDNSKNSLVVLLKSSDEKIKERLKRQYQNKKIMPFLNSETAKNSANENDKNALIEKKIEDSMKVYELRKPLYERLTKSVIQSEDKTLEQAAEEILKYAR